MRCAIGWLLLFPAVASPAPRDSDEVVVRKLIDALNDPDPEVRQNIALSLAKFGSAAVDPLTAALKDSSAERRSGAAYALALIGPPAKAALPALLDALGDKETDVRRQVSYAISRMIPSGRPDTDPVRPAFPAGGRR